MKVAVPGTEEYPRTSSLACVVAPEVTDGVVPLPVVLAFWSSGLTVATPLYSAKSARTVAEAEDVIVMVGFAFGVAIEFAAYQNCRV